MVCAASETSFLSAAFSAFSAATSSPGAAEEAAGLAAVEYLLGQHVVRVAHGQAEQSGDGEAKTA